MDTQDIEFAGAGVVLSGTAAFPGAAEAGPGVVLVGGSGPADRHNDGFFDALRGHLTAAGVAVLAYDKRGAGSSTGAWATATVNDLAEDAAAAVAVLQAHPRVVPGGVGVLGHSEGGWVGLRLCAGQHTVRHLIFNSCPSVSFLESEIFALTRAGAGWDTAADLYQQLAAAVRYGHEYQQGHRILAAHQREPWYAAVQAEGFSLDATAWSQLRAWADYDPHDDLVQLTTPALAIFGEHDPLAPVHESAARYQQTAAQAGRRQEIKMFPGADHRLRVGTDFAAGYLASLSTWCHEHAGGD